jgi:hypothetical protein
MYFRWKPYVPAAARRQTADRTVAKIQKEGQTLSPVAASRGAITKSFWGKAWCRNLERYSDYSNRLPRPHLFAQRLRDRSQDRSGRSDRPGDRIQFVPNHSKYSGSGRRTLAGDYTRLRPLHRHIGRAAPGATVDFGHGAHHPPGNRPLPVTDGDFLQLQLSGFGRDVQACRCDTLRNRGPARLGSGTSVRLAKGRR